MTDRQYISVNIECEVWDAKALWRKARDYLIDCGNLPEGSNGKGSLIGTERHPDLGACLIMLLDRSEHLDGTDIVESNTQ